MFVNRRDLGVIKYVVEAIAHWISTSTAIQTLAQRRLQLLSLRMQQLTRLLPGHVSVHGAFTFNGPSMQGAHYRSDLLLILVAVSDNLVHLTWSHQRRAIVHVLDICVADQDPVVCTVALALLRWHTALMDVTKIEDLTPATRALFAAFQPFWTAGFGAQSAKLHRVHALPHVIRLFGSSAHVSTSTYERAHQALKAVYPRYVVVSPLFPFFASL